MKLFLDDIRHPEDCLTYMHLRIGVLNPIYLKEWLIVRNFEQFKKAVVMNHKYITHVSFDHDLGEDIAIEEIKLGSSKRQAKRNKKDIKSGYDCAVWFKEFYLKNELKQPVLFVHSMNPIGTENIINLFK